MPNISSSLAIDIYYQNVRSIVNKADELLPNVLSSDYDIICFTETWFNSNV